MCVPGWITQAVAWTVCVGLYPAYHKLIFALSPEPLNFLFLTQLIVLLMMGLPRVQKLLLSRFLPRAEVSSHFLFISFHPIKLYGDFSCPFRCLKSSINHQHVLPGNCFFCRWILDVFEIWHPHPPILPSWLLSLLSHLSKQKPCSHLSKPANSFFLSPIYWWL